MSTLILKNPLFAVGDLDVSGDLSEGQLEYSADEVEDTRFGANTHQFAVDTIKTVTGSLSGRFRAGEGRADDRLFNSFHAAEEIFSATPTRSSGVGDTAFLMKAVNLSYSPAGSVGERYDFEAGLSARGDLVRGKLLHDATVTADDEGPAVQLGTVGSDERLYAALHVVAADGSSPTLDVTVESDDAQGFSSPVSRITFDQATGRTSQWKTLDGAVADDWFRIAVTVGGTDPSFTVIVTLGIR
ncbi:MAG: hypothetical protein ACLFWR_13805 [Acidimicrobiales bacterium]